MPLLELDSSFRRALRAAAHALRPVVQIGDKGLTPAVLAETDRALTAHGLIKVRVAGDDRAARQAIQDAMCDALSCAAVHHLGKVLIFYRPTEKDPQGLALQGKAPVPAAKSAPTRQPARVPKRLAADGHTEAPPPRRRVARPVRSEGSMSPRERYLGSSERAPRPTLHRERPAKGTKRTASGGRGSTFSLSARRRKP